MTKYKYYPSMHEEWNVWFQDDYVIWNRIEGGLTGREKVSDVRNKPDDYYIPGWRQFVLKHYKNPNIKNLGTRRK